MEAGRYTFVWLWAFNSPQDYYSTCFEVFVAENAADRQETLAFRGQTDFSMPCDTGETSNGEAGSITGCDENNTGATSIPPIMTSSMPQPDTPTPPPNTPSTPPPMDGTMGYVITNQMTGQLILPGAVVPPVRREIHVKFYADCANVARPNFWYARMDHKHDANGNILHRFRRHGEDDATEVIHYVLIQDNQEDIQRGYIGFHWAFEGGCRMLQSPTDVHVIDSV